MVNARHAMLPEDREANSIRTMMIGEDGYTYPWAMWADSDRRLWLYPDYPVHSTPAGTLRMRVELREDGWHVWPPEGKAYAPQSEPGYVSPRYTEYLPVAGMWGQ